jgi:hypothetical protein
MRILMESGVLYLAMSIAHFVAYFGHSGFAVHMNGGIVSRQKFASEMTISIVNSTFLQHTVVIGIAYDLIIIRVGQNRREEEANVSTGKLTTFHAASDDTEGKYSQSTFSVQTAPK